MPQSFTHGFITPLIVEEPPPADRVIVVAEPIDKQHVFVHSTFLADDVFEDIPRGQQLIVQAPTQILVPHSFAIGVILADVGAPAKPFDQRHIAPMWF